MRDEEDAERIAALDRPQHVENLGLHRHVECGNRLVGNQQLGVERERPREADALALPATELVGVALHRDPASSSSLTRCLSSRLGTTRCVTSGSATMWNTDQRGSSEA